MIKPKHKIVGFYGSRGVGKDTLYTYIEQIMYLKSESLLYCAHFAFADELKNDLNPISQLMFKKNVFDLKAEEKEAFRPLLISYGCAWRGIDPLHWVKIVDNKISGKVKTVKTQVSFITDVRFPNEAEFFKKKYKDKFLLIGLDRKGAPTPTDEEKKHIEEMKRLCDVFIEMKNDSSLKYTKKLAKYLLGFSSKLP